MFAIVYDGQEAQEGAGGRMADVWGQMSAHRQKGQCDGEQKCADAIGTVLVPWAGHFQ